MSACRLLSYNVRYAGLDEGDHAWRRRRDAVAAAVDRLDPAVACLQEVWRDQLAALRERLPAYEWVAERDPADVGEHTPIGYRPERVTPRAAGVFGIAPDPEDRTTLAWDAALPRSATWAEFAVDGRRVRCHSIHLDDRGARARLEGAGLLLERARTADCPAVLAGDYNSEPGDPAYDRLAAHLADARDLAGEVVGPAATYTGFGGDAVASGADERRLDHVFCTTGLGVERFAVDPSDASDHRPVVVDLQVGE